MLGALSFAPPQLRKVFVFDVGCVESCSTLTKVVFDVESVQSYSTLTKENDCKINLDFYLIFLKHSCMIWQRHLSMFFQ